MSLLVSLLVVEAAGLSWFAKYPSSRLGGGSCFSYYFIHPIAEMEIVLNQPQSMLWGSGGSDRELSSAGYSVLSM